MSLANNRLQSFVERIERLTEERKAMQGDINEVFAEAKSAGYDTKVMRIVIRERAMDAADRQEQEALLDIYRKALGLLADTPLGSAAVRRATKQFVDSVPKGSAISVTTPGGKGVKVAKDKDGKVTVGDATEPRRTGDFNADVEAALIENLQPGTTMTTRDGRTIRKEADGKIEVTETV